MGPLVAAVYLAAGGVLVALVACAFRRWRVAASAAGAAAVLTGVVCLGLVGGVIVQSREPVDPAMKATMLASGVAEAVSVAILALGVALVSVPLWIFARRRARRAAPIEAFISQREALLTSEQPELAFASDPDRGAQAVPGRTNEAAHALLRRGTSLKRLHDGAEVATADFERLLFVEAWDVLSATARASHEKPFEDGQLGSFGVVFVTTTPQPASRAKAAWDWPLAFELVEGHPLREAIAVIPFLAVRGADGTLTFHEGLDGCRYRGPGA